jgi:UDP-N-acetylmuramyl pentapeptide synthase
MIRRILADITALYGFRAPGRFVGLYRSAGGPFRYIWKFWNTQHFADVRADDSKAYRPLKQLLQIGTVGQYLLAVVVAVKGVSGDHVAGVLIGAGIFLFTPVFWAHVLFVLATAGRLLQPKRYGKVILAQLLEGQVRELRERNDMTVIAVAGSVGKTSTKLAIARMLESTGKRVRYQVGNYNDRLTVPLVFFGLEQPGIFNLPAWLRILMKNQRTLRQDYPADYVVVELGIDGPGQMEEFSYLHPELSVVTAVSEEHMAYFGDVATVAREELKVFDFSVQALINVDDVAAEYLHQDSYASYGLKKGDYTAVLHGAPTVEGQKLDLTLRGDSVSVTCKLLGEQGAKSVLAAAAVGHMLDIDASKLAEALEALQPFAGRMQVLTGIKHSVLIDDTYNASPIAVKAALDVLYAMDAPQRIAILGSMNEMGDISPRLHEEIGNYCDPTKIDVLVTVGAEAKKYLAPAAKKAGCTVKSFTSPIRAGLFVEKALKQHGVVLAKGSQNGVFSEEALKPLLADKNDAQKLVRQSAYWLKIKRSQFGG